MKLFWTIFAGFGVILTILTNGFGLVDRFNSPKPDIIAFGFHDVVKLPEDAKQLKDNKEMSTSTYYFLKHAGYIWSFQIQNKGKITAKDVILKVPFGEEYSLGEKIVFVPFKNKILIGEIKSDEEVLVDVWSDYIGGSSYEDATRIVYEDGGVVDIIYPIELYGLNGWVGEHLWLVAYVIFVVLSTFGYWIYEGIVLRRKHISEEKTK